MKIKGFEKISGYTYKGYTIVNPMHNAEETRYEATILNLNLPQKPKWELHVLTPAHRFKQDNHFSITMWDEHDFLTRRQLTIQTMRSISFFRNTIEEMIDELLKIQLTSAPISHSIVNNSSYGATINTNKYGKLTVAGTGGGILTTINSNANNIVWDPNTNLPSSMLIAIKDLQTQIDNLKINHGK